MDEIRQLVGNLGKLYLNKQVEAQLYKQVICSEGNDASLLLKTNIDEMLALKVENQKLQEKID